MARFKNKYRIESTRLPEWDYASAGWYFVTICVKNRQPAFGRIQNGEMRFSALGEIAHRFLANIPDHYPHTQLDAFVVMPDHVHAIIVINDEPNVETSHGTSLHPPRKQINRKFGPLQPGSLSKIIQAYKAAVTRQARREGVSEFAWQERFHDHIVRDDQSLQNIRAYILDNPEKWDRDELFYGK